MRDAIEQFRDAIRSTGLNPPDVIEPGKLHRFPGVGKLNGNKAGWCKLFADGLGGSFGDFSSDFSENWQAQRARPLSQAEREAFRRHVEKTKAETEAERKAKQAEAASKAAAIWQDAKPAAADHAYLVRKGIQAHGARLHNGALVIPMRDGDKLHSLQFIAPDGEKRFLGGGRVAGCYFDIGTTEGATALCIAEGFATGATIHEATGYPVAVAFNAGNLEAVARALRVKLPDLRLVLCADDDARTEGNPGLTKATEAARAVGALVAIPEFGTDRPEGATDFNDMRRLCGAEAVAGAIAGARAPAAAEHQPDQDSAPAGDPANGERQERVPRDEGGAKKTVKWPRFPRVWLDDAQANIEADYIIKGLVERGRLNVIFGPAGDGKTFFTLDLAGHIAAGIPWRGRRVRQGLVVYVAAEAGASILRRFSAWRDHHLSESREGRAPLAIITRAANLLNAGEVEELLEELRAIAEEAGLPLALVIFDTLSRSIAGGDENSAEDMTLVVGAADVIRDELGAAVAIVHHSGKDATKGARGHSSLFAAADYVVSVIERVATIDKARDGVQGDVFQFALDVVDLGTDSDGDACTTCIVRHLDGEAVAGASKHKKITASAQVALDALKAALDASGETIPATSILPRVLAVRVDKWQEVYARIRPIPQDLAPDETKRERNARRMAFRRAQDELQAVRVAGTEAGFWWLIGART